MDIEHRKYQRFSVKNTFAALRSGFDKIGKVNDIGEKGLAFSYLIERVKAGSYSDDSEVDIFLTGNGFYLHNVPCKIVYDILYPKSDKDYIIITRRCGLQFGKLSKSQSELLELFLENYTTEQLLS